MSQTATAARTVVVEREMPHPPEKIWRALTQSHLIGEWLMACEFAPVAGHEFSFSAEWGGVDCRVLTVEPHRTLAYTWAGMGLDTVVTWTLTPTAAGTRLRMEQAGFGPEQEMAYRGATAGWPRFLDNMEQVLARLD
ncbi:MAG: SRPBCC domain-containing protein [Phenylobacterium sp.]|uniref:SRPBCC family protein n=1 Tax=Phenylobacterium sp. TaxID=1871053 RepID=UPI00391B1DC6